jgi:hypothetical protein
MRATHVKRFPGHDIDGRADAAGGDIRPARLEYLHSAHTFGCEVGEIKCARCAAPGSTGATATTECVGSRHLSTVQQDHVLLAAESAHGDFGTFAVHAADGHAGDTLQRLCEIGIRELADVFSGDGVDDAVRVALYVHRRLQTAADARDHDFLDAVLCHCGPGAAHQQCRTHGGRDRIQYEIRMPNHEIYPPKLLSVTGVVKLVGPDQRDQFGWERYHPAFS